MEQNMVTKGRNSRTQVWNPFHKQMQKCLDSMNSLVEWEILTLLEAEVMCDSG